MSRGAIFHNRDAPTYYVKIAQRGKRAEPVDLTDRVIAFSFDEEESKADKLELSLDNFDLSLFDDPHWRHGNTLVVSWGYVGNMSKPRKMIIGKISGAKIFKVEALAESVLMNKEQKSRCFNDQSSQAILKAIAAEHGLPVVYELKQALEYAREAIFDAHVDKQRADKHGAAILSFAGESTQQANLTDAQFLASLARREGLTFHLKADGIHFGARNMSAAPTRRFYYYTDPGAGDVIDFNVENDVTMAPGRIVAKGRDPLAKTDIHEAASNTETKRSGLASFVGTASNDAHPVSHSDLSDRTHTRTIAHDAVVVTSAPTAALAKTQVDAKYVRAQQATVQLTMSVVGDPLVGSTQIIEVHGISKRLSGKYYVKSAKHKLTSSSYVLDLTCHTDGSHGSPATVGTKSDASLNTAAPADPKALKPSTVYDPINNRDLTSFRKP